MEFFAEYFTCIGFAKGATALFKLEQSIPAEKLRVDLKSLPYPYKMELLQKAQDKAPPTVKEILKSATAKCALDNNKFATAGNYLSSVDCNASANDPVADFSFIIASNKDQVLQELQGKLKGNK